MDTVVFAYGLRMNERKLPSFMMVSRCPSITPLIYEGIHECGILASFMGNRKKGDKLPITTGEINMTWKGKLLILGGLTQWSWI